MSATPVAYMERTRRYYAAQGFEKPYQWANFDDAPFHALEKPVAESRLALITTATREPRHETDPRRLVSGDINDPPTRLYANDLFWDRKATHLDDLNSYFPIDHLKSLVDTGRIGALAERFHCLPTEYSQRRTVSIDAPELLKRCREDGADLAMLVPL